MCGVHVHCGTEHNGVSALLHRLVLNHPLGNYKQAMVKSSWIIKKLCKVFNIPQICVLWKLQILSAL